MNIRKSIRKEIKQKQMKKNNFGFSLVELVIVIAIMAVLTGVLSAVFVKYVERGREASDIQNMKTVYDVAQADYSAETFPPGSTVYYERDSLVTHIPSEPYGKGWVGSAGTVYDNPCCEKGEYDPHKSYVGKYIIVIFPSNEGDSTIHIHWSE